MTERPEDAGKNMHVQANNNGRMFWEDWGRALYWDQPSKLSPLPIVRTSGKSP